MFLGMIRRRMAVKRDGWRTSRSAGTNLIAGLSIRQSAVTVNGPSSATARKVLRKG